MILGFERQLSGNLGIHSFTIPQNALKDANIGNNAVLNFDLLI
ncbi:predicted protein [Sclerotinia sclerotiorum 1980 UF-70]|uniref:Uncharacterized protein n=1 Tax=Sclerotinia sclerotiorum (strain ATCC 18683 / 1980 / Ss-1) TaxID=665079 RepID=A7E4L3_SCLS1|nr:predicted protein [Sclerotinia sclerotiorum 1980 UF-70]EDN90835.1 predicted protein [Sclerotinia sclerotiorum 1980 UF-70]